MTDGSAGIADLDDAAEEVGEALRPPSCLRACGTMNRVHIAQPWPAWKNAGDDGVRHDLIEVDVVEDDGRRLAAELEMHALQRRRRRRHDALAGDGAAGEADLVDQRALDQRRAELRAVAGDDVEDARRQVALLDRLGDQQIDQRARTATA